MQPDLNLVTVLTTGGLLLLVFGLLALAALATSEPARHARGNVQPRSIWHEHRHEHAPNWWHRHGHEHWTADGERTHADHVGEHSTLELEHDDNAGGWHTDPTGLPAVGGGRDAGGRGRPGSSDENGAR